MARMYYIQNTLFQYAYDNESDAMDRMVSLMQQGIGFTLVITPY